MNGGGDEWFKNDSSMNVPVNGLKNDSSERTDEWSNEQTDEWSCERPRRRLSRRRL